MLFFVIWVEKCLTDLIVDLVRGMEYWAHDEKGIHPIAWWPYKKAKAFMLEADTVIQEGF